MAQIRVYGRRVPAGGGEFAAAAMLLARAAVQAGLQVQLRPPWAFARGGLAESATLRVEREPILDASQDYALDLAAVADPSVVDEVDVLASIKPGGIVLFAVEGTPVLPTFSGKVVAAGLDQISSTLEVPLRFCLAGAINSLLGIVPPRALEELISGDTEDARPLEAVRQAAETVAKSRSVPTR